VLAGVPAVAVILKHSIAKPPPMPADLSIMSLQPEARGGKIWLGKSWVGQREGLTVVYLKGSPFEMGYADGVLMQTKMRMMQCSLSRKRFGVQVRALGS